MNFKRSNLREYKMTYKHRESEERIKVRDLGFGEKKIQRADGSEEKISIAMLHKNYVFESSTDSTVKNMSKSKRFAVTKPKRII